MGERRPLRRYRDTVTDNVSQIERARTSAVLREKQDDVARQAYKMRRAGLSYFQIAENLGVPEARIPKLMHKAISSAAELVSIGDRQELLAMEIERLDYMQSKLWPDVELGDIRAMEMVLKLIQERVKDLGLAMSAPEQQQVNVVSAVVVPSSTDDYAAALRRIAAGNAG